MKTFQSNKNICHAEPLVVLSDSEGSISASIIGRSRNKFGMTKGWCGMTRRGFTLAEVLITLGIIGVVAAITIPTLVSKYQAKVFETQFKKAASMLAQAYTRITAANDGVPLTCGDFSGGADMRNKFAEYLPKAKDYGSNVGYNPSYTGTYEFNYYYYSNRAPASIASNAYVGGQYMMHAGYFLSFAKSGTAVENGSKTFCFVWVDTNTPYKGPNRFGFDFFGFEITADGRFLPIGAKGTTFPEEEEIAGYGDFVKCKQNGSSIGWNCAYKAMSDANHFKNLPR